MAEVPLLAPRVVIRHTTVIHLPVLPAGFHVHRLLTVAEVRHDLLSVEVEVEDVSARPNVRLVGQVAKDLADPPVNVSIFQNSSARLS
ncbi:MAG: hypothetical protein UX89_C0029G0002 [Parcubacteria group bacterium GW2011_GWA2_47_16]|nr:MAG: hypothetical protein UX89_C0029G0002 [Parcubacteria group bacterium GW2011_GWA2_47_16]